LGALQNRSNTKEHDMTKADIVARIAQTTGMTKADTADVLDALLDAISTALGRGEKIEMRGFGIFKVERRKSRVARNPKTGQEIRIPPRAVPVFKPSDHLKDRVQQ
jgi:nucleoid DNA-binding protein